VVNFIPKGELGNAHTTKSQLLMLKFKSKELTIFAGTNNVAPKSKPIKKSKFTSRLRFASEKTF
jgi:hypothetical protein